MLLRDIQFVEYIFRFAVNLDSDSVKKSILFAGLNPD